MTQDTNTASGAADLLSLIDSYAEARHVGGCYTYNARTAAARNAVVAALESAAAQPDTAYAGMPDERAAFEAWAICEGYAERAALGLWWRNGVSEMALWAAWQARASRGQAPAQQGVQRLSEQDAGLLEQAASLLEDVEGDERNRGNCSTAEGAACSAHAVRRLASALLAADRAAKSAPTTPSVLEDAARYRHIRDVPHSEEVRSVLIHQKNAVMDRVIDKDRAALAAKNGALT